MKKRVKQIDMVRGIAIILIVFGHTILYSKHLDGLLKFIYSFHVLLFFTISGYVFKLKNNLNLIEYIKKTFKKIMIPYYIWAFIFLILYIFLEKYISSSINKNVPLDFQDGLIKIMIGNGDHASLRQNSSLWFLPALFSMQIMYYFIIREISKTNKKRMILLPILPIIVVAFLSYYFIQINFYLGFRTALELGIFYYVGWIFARFDLLNNKKCKKINLIIILLIGIASYYFNNFNVSCMNYQYGNIILAIIAALSFCYLILKVSFFFKENKFLEFIGKNTMTILIFHKLIILVFQTKAGIITSLLKNSNYFMEIFIAIIITMLAILISIIIGKFVEKIFPILIGKERKI